MLSESILREQFEGILSHVQDAEQKYADLAHRIEDADTLALVEQLRRDKLRHMSLAERLLEIIE